MKSILISSAVLISVFLVGCGDGSRGRDDQAEISVEQQGKATSSFETRALAAEADADNWLLHGRTYKDQRYSPLQELNTENVARLGLQWYIDLPRDGGQEATPIVIDGVMYFSAAWSIVHAVNAATGESLWTYDPQVPRATLGKACCGPVNRGVAYWEGKVIVGTLDGRLIAIDAAGGEPIWSTQTTDPNDSHTITGAPRVAKGLVFIGNGGAEFGVRGYVSAYDVNSGEQVWRFYTVPGDPSQPFENPILEKAAETWHGEWWKVGGGGTVYDAMSYDPETNLLYLGVGNASPYNPLVRTDGKGDNLFLASIVAVEADTGKYVWHYQTTPGESWDYTATQNMIFADLELNGETRKVIMQAPKNGFFYVLDRLTGELLSAEPFVNVTWASEVDMETGRPTISEDAKYWLTDKPKPIAPSAYGAHNWKPMAYSPKSGLVYIPATESATPRRAVKDFKWVEVGRNTGIEYGGGIVPPSPDMIERIKTHITGRLSAWDPVAQREVWSAKQETFANGGVLATAGDLVFIGTSSGFFRAYHAESGEKLWEFDAQDYVMPGPVTYRADGKQYIAVMAGRGGIVGRSSAGLFHPEHTNHSRMLVFALDGDNTLPDVDVPMLSLPDLGNISVDEKVASRGSSLYGKYCASCHGANAVGGGTVPDLRYSGFTMSQAAFNQVLLDGVLAARGMVSFAPSLSEQDVEAVRQYIILMNQYARKYGQTERMGR